MAGTQQPHIDPRMIEQTRKHINRLREEVARLSEMEIAPADYFGEFLMRLLQALAAPAGAVWVRTPHGNLQLQAQVQMQKVGVDKNDEAKQTHLELLRQAVQQGRPLVLQPQSSVGAPAGQGPAPGNPTDYLLLLAPIMMGNQVQGLIEVWQDPNRHPSAIQGFLQFIVHMGELASRYLRNRLLGDMLGQQELWTKMELFARQVHESLNPVEVAYRTANEGRRLIDCDRVSVGVRYGKKVVVEAVSGADVVEKRSNLVQKMRKLFEKVLNWGEKLVYAGTPDESLPPDVHKALDEYLEESNSKLLCILPLQDEREKDEEGESESKNKPPRKPRSVLMMECFEPSAAADALLARQEVLGRHAASALYNAVEHRRIPFRFIWAPIAKVQEGLGGKTRAILWAIGVGLLLLAAIMYLVPYPLKMDASGQLLPEERRWVFAPLPAEIIEMPVEAGSLVGEKENLVKAYNRDVEGKLERLNEEIRQAEIMIATLSAQRAETADPLKRFDIDREIGRQRITRDGKVALRATLTNNISLVGNNTGEFWLRSPEFPNDTAATRPAGARWTVLNWDYKEKLSGAEVKPSDPILRLGYVDGPWEVLLKIPQKNIGQVLKALDRLDQEKRSRLTEILDRAIQEGWLTRADIADWLSREALAEALKKASVVGPDFTVADLDRKSKVAQAGLVEQLPVADLLQQVKVFRTLQNRVDGTKVLHRAVEVGWLKPAEAGALVKESELDVDLLVKSAPTDVYKGKLARSKIAGAADQHRDDNNEQEPVVVARVRIAGADIPEADQIPRRLLLTDTQVNAKVRCGSHRMGYSLFYGVWEFFYEKVVFFF